MTGKDARWRDRQNAAVFFAGYHLRKFLTRSDFPS
jgi:hypothetical protein